MKKQMRFLLVLATVLTLALGGTPALAEEVVVPAPSTEAGWNAGTGVHTVIGTEGAPSGTIIDLADGATLDLRDSDEEVYVKGNNTILYRGKKNLTIIGDPDKTYSFYGTFSSGGRYGKSPFYMTQDEAVVTLVNFKWSDFTDDFTIMNSKVKKITIRYQGECELPELYDSAAYVFEPLGDDAVLTLGGIYPNSGKPVPSVTMNGGKIRLDGPIYADNVTIKNCEVTDGNLESARRTINGSKLTGQMAIENSTINLTCSSVAGDTWTGAVLGGYCNGQYDTGYVDDFYNRFYYILETNPDSITSKLTISNSQITINGNNYQNTGIGGVRYIEIKDGSIVNVQTNNAGSVGSAQHTAGIGGVFQHMLIQNSTVTASSYKVAGVGTGNGGFSTGSWTADRLEKIKGTITIDNSTVNATSTERVALGSTGVFNWQYYTCQPIDLIIKGDSTVNAKTSASYQYDRTFPAVLASSITIDDDLAVITPTGGSVMDYTYRIYGGITCKSITTGEKVQSKTVKIQPTPKYTITVDSGITNGTVAPSHTTAAAGTEITLTVTPATSYVLDTLTVTDKNGNAVTVTDGKFTMPASNVTVSAMFKAQPAYTVTVTTNDDSYGGATATPTSGKTGTKVTLTATPNSGYQFKEWQVVSGGVTIGEDNTFTIGAANVEIKAVFEEVPTIATPTFSLPSGSVVDRGTTVTITCATDGATIYYTTDGNYPTTASTEYNAPIAITENTTITALAVKGGGILSDFASASYTIKVDAATPVISTQPVSASYVQGAAANQLNVTATVSDGGTLSYQWYSNTINSNEGGAAIDGATDASYTPPTDTVGTAYYYCVVTNTNDAVTGAKTAQAVSEAAVITVNAKPVVLESIAITKAPDKTAYTEGENFDSTGMEVTAYYSDGSNRVVTGWTVTDGTNLTVDKTNVTVSYTEGGVPMTTTQAITVNVKPVYSISAEPANIDFGRAVVGYEAPAAQTVTIRNTGNQSISLNQPTAVNYQIGSLVYGDGIATFTVQPKSGMGIGNYAETIQITGSNNISASVQVTFTVNEQVIAPTITEQPKSTSVMEGASFSYTIRAEGVPTPTYQWQTYLNGEWVNIGNATDATYSETANLAMNGAQIRCIVSNAGGSVVSDVVTLTVSALPVLEIVSPIEDQIVTVYEGETAKMSVVANHAIKYQWFINRNDGKGWIEKRGATSPNYTSSVTELDNDGFRYFCRVYGEYGQQMDSPIFTLEVLKVPVLPDTGDDRPIGLWIALLVISLTGLLAMLHSDKRRYN